VSGGRASSLFAAAWVVLVLGVAGAVASARAMWRGDHADPNFLALLLVFVPYIAAVMLLQITRKARLVIVTLFFPALADVLFGCVLTFGGTPGWDAEITWRLLRGMACTFLLLVALGVGLWLERLDARMAESGHG
jgi:hypothetical protein